MNCRKPFLKRKGPPIPRCRPWSIASNLKRQCAAPRKSATRMFFEPLVSRTSAQHRMIDELVALFGGKSLPIVAHLIDSGKLTPEEVSEARKALRNATRKDKSQ